MAALANYPFINQLNSPTLDGKPDNNKWFNCVVCSIMSAMLFFRPELRGTIEPDDIKDAVYGPEYANGGTDAAKFVPYVAQFGLRLYSISDTPARLVIEAHKLIQNGQPAIFTELDPYCTEYQRDVLGWTHVCSFYKEIPDGLDAMDPFGGVLRSDTDANWTPKLRGNLLWTMEPIQKVEEEQVTIDLNNPEVAKYFELANSEGTQWRCRATGKIIQFGILEAYKAYGNSALCGLTYLGLPQSNEIPLPGIPGAVKQYFERGTLIYDVAHKNDSPPGSGAVYPAHLYTGAAQDPRVSQIAPLQAQVSQLQTQVKQLQAQIVTDTVVNPQAIQELQAKLAQIKAIVG